MKKSWILKGQCRILSEKKKRMKMKGWRSKVKTCPSKYIMQNQLVVLELLIAIINMVSCNSKRLPLLVDRHGSTTCSWCSVLSNLLVNPWASKCVILLGIFFFGLMDFRCSYSLYAAYFAEKWQVLFSVDIDQEKAPKFGWRGIQWFECLWSKLFCFFCRRKSCCCCYMPSRCCKNPQADRG